MDQFLSKAIRGISLKVLMKTLTFGDLNESCSPPVPLKDHHDPDPAPLRGHKGSICKYMYSHDWYEIESLDEYFKKDD